MSHRHRKLLQAIFAHPVSSNIDPRAVQHLFEHLGAEVQHGGHGQLLVTLNGHTQGFHDTHHSLSKEEVVQLRRFLEAAGVEPAAEEA